MIKRDSTVWNHVRSGYEHQIYYKNEAEDVFQGYVATAPGNQSKCIAPFSLQWSREKCLGSGNSSLFEREDRTHVLGTLELLIPYVKVSSREEFMQLHNAYFSIPQVNLEDESSSEDKF